MALRTTGEVNGSKRSSRQSAYCRDAITRASGSATRRAGSSEGATLERVSPYTSGGVP